jgi:ATP-dependent protease Clp ATPase subunit
VTACSFCSLSADHVGEIVVGPHVNVCNVCVAAAMKLVDRDGSEDLQSFPEPCNFCRQTLTRTQFRGQQARICEDCIVMASDILSEQRASKALPQARLIKG